MYVENVLSYLGSNRQKKQVYITSILDIKAKYLKLVITRRADHFNIKT